MKSVFADTSYYIAFISNDDSNHEAALHWARRLAPPVITTDFVLVELGNALARAARRETFVRFVADLRADRQTVVMPASRALLNKGIELYGARRDKDWSLTDCMSFVVMRERGLNEALTSDHHFTQAGFTALLGRA